MLIEEGGGPVDEVAPYTFIGGEPTIHSFSPDHQEQATRFEYQADASGVVYSLVVSGEALKFPDLIATVAGEWAATWNINAAVAGVEDIAESQDVKPLGGLEDVVQVAVSSPSGKSTSVLTLRQSEVSPDVFAAKVSAERARLAKFEASP